MNDSGKAAGWVLEEFIEYLHLLARLQLGPRPQTHVEASDIVQQTLLEAQQKLHQFQGQSKEELAAWLRRALVHNLADAFRALGRAKRDVSRERSLEEALDQSASRLESW